MAFWKDFNHTIGEIKPFALPINQRVLFLGLCLVLSGLPFKGLAQSAGTPQCFACNRFDTSEIVMWPGQNSCAAPGTVLAGPTVRETGLAYLASTEFCYLTYSPTAFFNHLMEVRESLTVYCRALGPAQNLICPLNGQVSSFSGSSLFGQRVEQRSFQQTLSESIFGCNENPGNSTEATGFLVPNFVPTIKNISFVPTIKDISNYNLAGSGALTINLRGWPMEAGNTSVNGLNWDIAVSGSDKFFVAGRQGLFRVGFDDQNTNPQNTQNFTIARQSSSTTLQSSLRLPATEVTAVGIGSEQGQESLVLGTLYRVPESTQGEVRASGVVTTAAGASNSPVANLPASSQFRSKYTTNIKKFEHPLFSKWVFSTFQGFALADSLSGPFQSLTPSNGLNGHYGNDFELMVKPANGSTPEQAVLIAATNINYQNITLPVPSGAGIGLARSVDGGQSFQTIELAQGIFPTGIDAVDVTEIEVVPFQNGEQALLIAAQYRIGEQTFGRILISYDYGQTLTDAIRLPNSSIMASNFTSNCRNLVSNYCRDRVITSLKNITDPSPGANNSTAGVLVGTYYNYGTTIEYNSWIIPVQMLYTTPSSSNLILAAQIRYSSWDGTKYTPYGETSNGPGILKGVAATADGTFAGFSFNRE